MTPPAQRRYIPGLDGLRALAVIAVVAYHLGLPQAAGGLLGVDVFFVISGYLITDQLVAEYRRSGRIHLGQFWLRRARRLLPALYFMLLAVAAWLALFDPARLASLRGDLLAAFLYVSNWWFIFHKVSYFARFGPPSPLGHLWSLAVEEQFYLLWPLLLLAGLRLFRRPRRLLPPVLLLGALSALAMALLFQPGGDPTRVYDGTDTRAFALLLGAALALLGPGGEGTGRRRAARLGADLAGALGLAVIVAAVARSDEYGSFLYRGGMVLVSLAAAAAVAATLGEGLLGRLLALPPLRWVGLRSYGIYLWQYPVIALSTPPAEMGSFAPLRAGLQVAATLLLAAFSYRYVEEPLRRGKLGRWREPLAGGGAGRHPAARGWATGAVALLVVGVASWGLAGWGAAGARSALPASDTGELAGWTGSLPAAGGRVAGVGGGAGAGEGSDFLRPGAAAAPAGAAAGGVASGRGVTAIGDSVLLDVAPDLEEQLPGVVIDARVGRQLVQAREVVDRLRAEGRLGDRVILELGTNGPFTREQLAALLDDLSSARRIILVNVRVPRPWQRVVNATLAEAAAGDPRVELVDWYAASEGHGEYFDPDGVHLDPEGARVYAGLLARAVAAER